ncbi:hypothetical protein N599_21670 [Saccharopolyspora erythraea D]|nr:hypothetical protein N599_21670 [Saccharopolyspora erythraea D]
MRTIRCGTPRGSINSRIVRSLGSSARSSATITSPCFCAISNDRANAAGRASEPGASMNTCS